MQSSFHHAALPEMRLAQLPLIAGLLGLAPNAAAQVQLALTADVAARPGGPVVAALMPGARIVTGSTSGASTQATFEGWVDASRLGARRDSFPASVSGRLTLRVRSGASPNAAVVAVLQPGAGVHTLGSQGTWMRVRRTAWIASSALQRAPGVAQARGAEPVVAAGSQPPRTPAQSPPGRSGARSGASAPAGAPRVNPAAKAGAGHTVVASTGARVHDLPVGSVVGGLTPGTSVEIVGRQFGWVRVRSDGWVREADLVAGEGAAPPSISAADLRADPHGMKGKVVQWDVEIMSLQVADPLRVGMAREEPYLLARGPGEENVVLYLAVPPSLLTEARGLAPLSRVSVTAKVRNGRSDPAGTPILDLITIIRR